MCRVNIYQALLRAALDYGCLAYMSASESNLKKLDVEQAQALRISTRVFKSSLVSALQAETGEMLLRISRVKTILAYWINLHGGVHPTKAILQDCSEHSRTNY